MKQVVQNLRSGKLSVKELPDPLVAAGHVLIANQASVVSAGTEKMVMDLAKKSLLGKALQRPDQVRRVVQKVRNEGLWRTVQQVQRKLDEPMTMGYSSAGIVIACGADVQEFKPGDRVASNGPHAELVSVPRNLCAHVPDGVPLDQAAFAVLGSIALQGIRLTKANLGESVLVIGLGLVGQLTVAILQAAGVHVIGTDPDQQRCQLAQSLGARSAAPNITSSQVLQQTRSLGADAVIITASTASNQPIELAAECVRPKGRVVLVGVVGLQLDRRPWYFKEAEFVVSCSYGPGRYDAEYEERGNDYPPAYVRWTEQRNIQAVLQMMATGRLDVRSLITHRFDISSANDAYDLITRRDVPFLGVVIDYPSLESRVAVPSITIKEPESHKEHRCGVLGAGNFARMVMLPAIQSQRQWEIATICSQRGLSGTTIAEDLGIPNSCTDDQSVFQDDRIQTIFSLTRHDQHAGHVLRAIEADKNIFVEKPLCLTVDQLMKIEAALLEKDDAAPVVAVGFNRRFSRDARAIKRFFEPVRSPLTVSIRFNAGAIGNDHWTQDSQEGGGRIIGEACHGIDLATYLCGAPVVRVFAESVAIQDRQAVSDDQCFITLRHSNGSISSVAYLSGGDTAYPKERVEVFGGGMIGIINNFCGVETSQGGSKKKTTETSDKGHQNEIADFADGIANRRMPIPWPELRATSLAAILAVESLRTGEAFEVSC